MTKQKVVEKRREEISLCLQKSITTPKQIAKQTGIERATVANDLFWMQKKSQKWLSGHTLDGYIFETKNTIDQLKDIETELQLKRQAYAKLAPPKEPTESDDKIFAYLMIIKELKNTINMRWQIQGDGPTYMNLKSKKSFDT